MGNPTTSRFRETAGAPLEEPVLPGTQEKLDELIEFIARHFEATEPQSV